MTPVDARRGNASEGTDWLHCTRTQALLGRLDAEIDRAVTAQDAQLRVMALHVVRRGGKRLRPALLMLCGSLGPCPDGPLLKAAAALELIHVASLYHDDIMDRAPVRRGGPSTQARWGDGPATFAGAYLFARACTLWADLGGLTNRLASEASVDLCRGQLGELEHAFDLDTPEQRHLEILTLKTGSLFSLPCRIGAALAGLDAEAAASLQIYGDELGRAFQLADDLLDLTGEVETIGKLASKDLREGIYSLPVLRALRNGGADSARLRDLLTLETLEDNEVGEAVAIVRASGAVESVRDQARRGAEAAGAAIAQLPDGPAKDSLRALAALAVERTH